MKSGETVQEKRGAAPEQAAGAELQFDECFELTDEALEGLAGGDEGTDDSRCRHDMKFVRKVKGTFWGYNEIHKCTKCGFEQEVIRFF